MVTQKDDIREAAGEVRLSPGGLETLLKVIA